MLIQNKNQTTTTMDKHQEELLQQAAIHFQVLKNEKALLCSNGKFFLTSEKEKLESTYGPDEILLIRREEANDYLGDALYL